MLFTDHLHNTIKLTQLPQRIVSLVPSQTELLCDLGLQTNIVGATKFCIHPKNLFITAQQIGGTKTLHIEKIKLLKPDLIIGNKEENIQSQIKLLQHHFKVWISDIFCLKDALKTINDIGTLTGTSKKAKLISNAINQSFNKINTIEKTVLYLIWKPYMGAGANTFIGDMLHKMGLKNVLKATRYPELTIEQIINLNPQILFLSSEPFPFNKGHLSELQNYLPHAKIVLVDGELFSWYGSRLQKSVAYFNKLIEDCKTN